MLITRLTSPSFVIVDSDTLAEWLRIDSSTDTATTDLLVASATDYIECITGRVLAAANYQIDYDELAPSLPLNIAPLNSVTSVSAKLADGTAIALTAGTDYLTQAASAAPSIMLLNVPTGAVSISVLANAGYTNAAAVPASIQHAAAILVAASYDSRSALDPATATTVTNLVSRYRRVVIG
jgi:uncharacterized phiE125 gp8 family phage protein